MTQPPSLNGLRSFVVAARRLSFTAAAHELHVTPAAVSRSVKGLEEQLGCALFVRNHRAMTLTPEGVHYLDKLEGAFEQIAEATADLHKLRAANLAVRRSIKVCAYPSFAVNWLIPRWYRFARTDPGFHLDVVMTHTHDVAFEEAAIDAAILSDRVDYEDCRHEHLFDAHLAPVCNSTYQAPPIEEVACKAWSGHLLHSRTRPNDWKRWAQANGWSDPTHGEGELFQNSTLMYEAVMASAGVAVAILEVVERLLRSGALVLPYPNARAAKCPFYLITPRRKRHALLPALGAFLRGSSQAISYRRWDEDP